MRLVSSKLWLGTAAAVCVVAAAATAVAWSSQQRSEQVAHAITGGNPTHGPDLLRRYGCGGCHTIPGVPGADGQVGPPLAGLLHRVYIGGVAINSADNLVQWIVAPQQLSPNSVMPATGISEAEARDVAAYLYSR
ncbi:MAG: c-type cytochrome [Bradyrhizobium sp.]|uniref:c-type cytochrome n=1 Tax=Bradyrhizobium sp. TaxID=376 RepID=UPI001DA7A0C4|nr:c-type cytochrome [Bradyrhizobium sp.]MBV9561441.1 c-type cytochrome [Bradyrhizobium sp.]